MERRAGVETEGLVLTGMLGNVNSELTLGESQGSAREGYNTRPKVEVGNQALNPT